MIYESAGPRPQSVLDLFERVAILILYGYFFSRILPGVLEGLYYNSIVLFVEAIVVIFVLIRRPPKALSYRPDDWALAFIGTAAPFLFAPSAAPLVDPAIGVLILLAGFVFQSTAKLFLRRSFGIVAANRGVMLGGPYSLIRHPIYAGYMISHVGFLLLNPLPWNLGIFAVVVSANVARLIAEERLLKGDPIYEGYLTRVKYRLVPGLF